MIERVITELQRVRWQRGSETAGPIASIVKHNWQAKDQDTAPLRTEIMKLLMTADLFLAMIRPQTIGLMFSRYEMGCSYGTHVDSPLMDGVRRDVSFTVFLSEPSEYDGGDLVIETPMGETRHKLGAGSMVLYPATSLHRVETIKRGTRLVIVGWARSYIRDAAQRELLFELDLVKSRLFADVGKTALVDVLSRCSANLQRMWLED